MINVSLPDGSIRQFDQPVTVYDVAASIGPGLAKAALAVNHHDYGARWHDEHRQRGSSSRYKLFDRRGCRFIHYYRQR